MFKSVIKVDSHQLCPFGKNIKNEGSRRYDRLIPNMALLSANHWADHAASCAIKDEKRRIKGKKNLYRMIITILFIQTMN